MKEVFISKSLQRVLGVAMALAITSCNSTTKSDNSKAQPEPLDSVRIEKRPVESLQISKPFKFPIPNTEPLKFKQQLIQLKDTSFKLTLPKDWNIKVAKEGFGRLRFLTKSPDGRLFVTDMKNRTDNSKGQIILLDKFDKKEGNFGSQTTYLENLRNPNNTAFHTDSNGVDWLYVALTHKLVRYKYSHGENSPTSEEQLIAEFPDYGLSYKYGGWHLTRTVAIHNEKLYVSIGSSCNACEEKEAVRASILEMDLDGNNSHHYAYGVRNAVDINWIHGELFSTNMGADHLGDDAPDEALYQLEKGKHYGWPYYYQEAGKIIKDDSQEWKHDSLSVDEIPLAYAELGGHSAPLGFEYFEGDNWPKEVQNYFIVALHGSGHVRIGNGYNVVRVYEGSEPEPLISGWLQNGHRFGRPTDVFIYDEDSFFITDDHEGVLYYVEIGA